ncbi:DUF6916 family protein [Nocardioides sp. T2.26MG-1]|uniref:DUF6916 family protein n=1 Tax=Nocardioides sp. T2.26MG-1 TaxID=3041166 RepID=UPI002477B5D3|nr:hypothetical protein [Nocardioides sp. T2.26MG-1]CAI9412571.1 hypothetical protein HIDPHFAB_01805 [Nocardioides sp. T2.26MG-1]
MTGIQWLTCDQFAPLVGEEFQVGVAGGSRTVSMVLTEATEGSEPGGTGPDGQSRRQFSLVFRGPGEPALPQGTYVVGHPGLGRFELFLVPIARDADALQYEAAFA